MFSFELNRIDEVVQRVSALTEKRFGVGLQFLPFDLESCDPTLRALAEGRKIFRLNQRIYSPVFDVDRLLGFVISLEPFATPLSKTEMGMVQMTIDLGLAELLARSTDLQNLGFKERLLSPSMSGATNVVPFKKSPHESIGPMRPSKRNWPRKPCVIEAELHNDRLALALEFHELSGNLGFIYFQEAFPSMRFSTSEWSALSSCTVFIPDAQSLDLDLMREIVPTDNDLDYSENPLPILGLSQPTGAADANREYADWMAQLRSRRDIYHVRVSPRTSGFTDPTLFRNLIQRTFPILS